MSLIRIVFWLAVIVLLLPTDQGKQAQIAGTAGAAFERAVTFCDRNPTTCVAGSELWATFVRKAEFGMELAVRLARDEMSKAQQHQRAPVGGQGRFEPVQEPGTLRSGDLTPQWRGQSTRAAY